MLSEIKTIVDIFESLFNLRKGDRDRVAALFDQVAQELQTLAELWQAIVTKLAASSTLAQDCEVLDLVQRQSNHFSALSTIVSAIESAPSNRLDHLLETDLVAIAFDALAAKGELYALVHAIVYPDVPLMERAFDYRYSARAIKEEWSVLSCDDPALSDADRMIARYYERQKATWDRDDAKYRNEALDDLHREVTRLQTRAGQLRAQLALYKARLIS